ncbi:type I restriction-modification enzyme R subunit C-terminal domain-containing protein [Accumulibacter sp.]|uniref:type I restriction endonuclease subunit R n=2 Tax=Accumulibacter sp. TaxID=2053492 RepID=UPI0025E32F66|nr:type I restriction-modification enzyme R subunit C-terminal domain-containing protein [Accumulibacter sp.]MCM8635723.1 DEAD/DEAH box helicase family protein [Accumulibacter sp.]
MGQAEGEARRRIDTLLAAAGWRICDAAAADIHAARGVAIREFPLEPGHGFADYLLYLDGRAAGVIEAKKQGATLTGVEIQSARYAQGLPATLPAWRRPLPFLYESTGLETHFTDGLDPEPRARSLFAFHRPETLAEWLAALPQPRVLGTGTRAGAAHADFAPATFRARVRHLPPLVSEWGDCKLWPAQITAIRNLEASLAQNRPRALIQMATGSGKTFTAISFIYRLIKFAGARRVLFLVDRGNLGRQTKKEFDQYVSPVNNYKFGEEFIVQHLTSNQLDRTARVCICTIQRMYSMLKGRDLPEEADEESTERVESLFKEPEPIDYNPAFPIETFDIIVTDEAHRSIYNLWRQVLEYFDAHLIGLTATPNKQTFGFFNQNLVMEYGHPQAVADGVNVNYDIYRIKTEVTEAGATVEAGYWLQVLDKPTRARRLKLATTQLDDDFEYAPEELDRSVQTPDQIRTIARTLRDRWQSDLFPQRQELPKTLVFAKDDNHAEAIVGILREEWGRGNEFAQKITYRTTGSKPEELIKAFRTSYYPRIAVTVDMIATGTDIKPVEIVVFMRSVKSRSFFEQMKGRGVRVIKDDDLRGVNPGERVHKDRFVIVDCVGVCERDKTDSRPMDQKKSVPLDALLQAVSLGNVEPEVLSSVAVRLARLDAQLTDAERARVVTEAGGLGLKELARGIVQALDPREDRSPQEAEAALRHAVKPFSNPTLRTLILTLKQQRELVIDTVTQDRLIGADFSEAARERAQGIVQSFEAFIAQHRDEITALQILYNRPTKAPLKFEDLKALADTLQAPPHLWTESQLWQAYAALDKGKVKGARRRRILTDLVSLVRYAMHQDNELVPYPEKVIANFNAWLAQQQAAGKGFTDEQRWWLEKMAEHIASNLGIEAEDFGYAPFDQRGGLGRVHQLFGAELPKVIDELNRELVA